MNILYISLSSLSNKTRLINVFNNFNKLPHSWVVPLISPCLSLPPSQWWTASARLLIISTRVSYSLKVSPAKNLDMDFLQTFAEWALEGSHAPLSKIRSVVQPNLSAARTSFLPSPALRPPAPEQGPVVFFGRGGWTRVCDRPDSAQTRGRGALYGPLLDKKKKKKKTKRD